MYCKINRDGKRVKILRYFFRRGLLNLIDNGRHIDDTNYAVCHEGTQPVTVLLYSGSAYGEQGEQLSFREFLKRCIVK